MSQDIQHEGVVVSAHADEVRVLIEQTSACHECRASSMCAAADKKEKFVDCRAVEPLEQGDKVVVTVARKMGFQAVLLAFVIPFCLLLGLIALFDLWIANEAVAGTVALCSLIPYYGILALCRGKMKKHFVFYAHKI